MIDYVHKVGFVVPALGLLLALTAYPLFLVVQMSQFDYADTTAPALVGMANFAAALQNPAFWNAVVNTLVFTIGGTIGCIVVGLTLALLLNQPINARIRGVFRSAFMVPWLFSSAVVGAVWTMMLNPFGLINHLLGLVGLSGLATTWLGEPGYAMGALIVTNVWRSAPFAMLMFLAALQALSSDLIEAAAIDGAGAIRRFRHVILPHLRPVMLTMVTLEVIWNFRTFDLIYIMTGGGPLNSTDVLSTYIYTEAFRRLDFGGASAASLVMLVLMLAVSALYLRAAVGKESR